MVSRLNRKSISYEHFLLVCLRNGADNESFQNDGDPKARQSIIPRKFALRDAERVDHLNSIVATEWDIQTKFQLRGRIPGVDIAVMEQQKRSGP